MKQNLKIGTLCGEFRTLKNFFKKLIIAFLRWKIDFAEKIIKDEKFWNPMHDASLHNYPLVPESPKIDEAELKDCGTKIKRQSSDDLAYFD